MLGFVLRKCARCTRRVNINVLAYNNVAQIPFKCDKVWSRKEYWLALGIATPFHCRVVHRK
ncbi:MAG: hypothetical protein QXR17_07685 [Candidatus Bathyarchaeia archaeon]